MVVLIVLIAVVIQVIAAVSLKELADRPELPLVLVTAGIGAVALLNGVRFLVWGYVHKRYPLSHSYPLNSMFFPLMLAVAWAYGEAIRFNQVAGTALISLGVIWIALKLHSDQEPM